MSQPMPGSRSLRSYTPRVILDGVEPGTPLYTSGRIDATYAIDGANGDYTDEIREGTVMARNTTSKQWAPCKRSAANGQAVAGTAFVADVSAPFKAGDTVSIVSKREVCRVADDDNAASTGVALYVHVDELDEKCIAHLESVTAGNADFYQTMMGGAKLIVEDDDAAATGGVALYFDEDAANPDERFLAAVSTAKDCFLPLTDGRMIRVKYHASPSSVGVQVYGDDDAATATAKFLFVSPTNVSGVMTSDDVVGWLREPVSEVVLASGLTISSIVYSTNTITLDTAATWADGDCHLVASGALAGFEIPRGVCEEWVKLYDHKTRALVDKSVGKIIIGNAKVKRSAVAAVSDITACLAAAEHYLDSIYFMTDGVRVKS